MTPDTAAGEWGRRQLIIMLAAVTGFVAIVVGALGYVVVTAINSGHDQPVRTAASTRDWPVGPDGTRGERYRDQVAARRMLTASASDMTPAAPIISPLKPIILPAGTKSGPSGVTTGFDHTPEGAVGQLAAIEVATLEPMSLQYARDIYTGWAASPAGFDRWEIADSIREFHTAAGTVDADSNVALTATPVGAQVKGTDGPDWVLACVQLDVTAAVVQETRFGFGHCERMRWDPGQHRWMIAPGTTPAVAPSTWPGSQRSVDAGWRPLLQAGETE